MWSNRVDSAVACLCSGAKSGCLTFQRPDICSTTSLESINTSTSVAPSLAASSSPAISPRYSATLLVARPIACLLSASTAPWSVDQTTVPYPAGPGLPRDPPSASTMTFMRRPSCAGSLDPQQDCSTLRTAQHLVIGRRGDARQLSAVDLDPARAAPATLQQSGPRPAAGTLTFVHRDQICVHRGDQFITPRDTLVSQLVELCARVVARLLSLGPCGLEFVALGQLIGLPGLQLLPPLHHLHQRVLQAALAALQRPQLVLKLGELLGIDGSRGQQRP